MDVVRRISLSIGAALLGAAVLIGWVGERPSMSPDAARDLARATTYFDSTIVLARAAEPRGARGDQLAVALGYLERLRIGLGSPFRLMDEALNDPRIPQSMQSKVAWALVARLRRGDAYVVDPSVLDGIGPWDDAGAGATGAAHLALIEHTIQSAPDPRAGELTVRLAYLIAAAEGSVSPAGVGLATNVAALVRDRALAIRDANDALADANQHHTDVLELLQSRRVAHALSVEAPPLTPLSDELRAQAMNAVPALVAAIDTLRRVVPGAEIATPDSSLIGPSFARRLAAIGARRPPTAPIVVTLRSQHVELGASNEETLVAALSSARPAVSDSAARALDRAVLAATVALRPLAQQVPWFPGDPAPTAGEVSAEFGLGAVTFARNVPNAWRPYYLRELETALGDMSRVFPSLAFDGLRVRFTAEALPDSALAMHDPRTRTLHLSIATSAGTIAHELAHDLDWQSARRLFADGGGYSTDRSVRERRGPLASSVHGLAEARTMHAYATAGSAPTTDRPAELFARSTDWFVASALAAQGRTNGFLTAVQDAMLAGYAAGSPTIAGSRAGGSLLAALDEMTLITDSSRFAFERTWSDPAEIDPAMMVRRVLDTPVSWRAVWSSPPDTGDVAELPAVICTPNDGREMQARRQLIALAIDARARGTAERWARRRASRGGVEWANSLLGIAPWSPTGGASLVSALRFAIAGELVASPADQGVVPAVPPIFRSNSASCSAIAR